MKVKVVAKQIPLLGIENMTEDTSVMDSKAMVDGASCSTTNKHKKKSSSVVKTQNDENEDPQPKIKSVRRKKSVISKAKSKAIPKKTTSKK